MKTTHRGGFFGIYMAYTDNTWTDGSYSTTTTWGRGLVTLGSTVYTMGSTLINMRGVILSTNDGSLSYNTNDWSDT